MKLTAPGLLVILTMLFVLPAAAQQDKLLSRTYKPDFSEATIKIFLEDIESKTRISISYSNSSINITENVKLTGNENSVGAVLTTILANQKIDILARKNKILLIPSKENKTEEHRKVTINGYIKEAGSQEALIGATIVVPELKTGTVTNNYGFYSLSVPEGYYQVLCSYIGYKTDTFSLNIRNNTRKDVLLSLHNVLTEVKVNTTKKTAQDHIRLSYADIQERPSLLGETDVMRALQNTPGIASAMEGSNKILVRGGDPGQNLNLIDGVPLYYTDHFLGLTSIFNSEAINAVDFYKGGFPARYGGRISSIIDISTKDGDMEKWGGQFSMGLVKGSVNLEGPIIKDKASVMLSFRRTWLDAIWRLNKHDTSDTKIDFYDVNFKANYILNKDNRLYISVYNGRDQLGIDGGGNSNFYTNWGNTVGSIKWNRIVSSKVFLNTMLTYSYFRFSLNERTDIITPDGLIKGKEYKGVSTIKDIAFTSQATWYPNAFHRVETGVHYSNAHFVPVSIETNTSSLTFRINPYADRFNSNEITVFAEDEIKLNNRWTLRPGLHFANWFSKKFNYSSLQPRLYTAYKIADQHTIYASVTQMAQFLHMINNNTYGLYNEFWIPSSANIVPEESYMGTLGYDGKAGKNFNYNLEFYYKDIRHVTTYSMGKNLFDNTRSWEDNIIQGNGWSYGAELSLKEKIGSFRFRGAYTLSWSWRQFAELNDGVAFPYRYDRRHNIKIAAIYKPSEKFELSANWTYMSGEAMTLPDQVYPDLDNNLLISQNNNYYSSGYTYNYVEWNNYRLPPIHRLDLAMNFTKIKGKHTQRIWSVGVYNAYMRRNVMLVDLQRNFYANEGFKLVGMSFLQFIPFVSYQLKF